MTTPNQSNILNKGNYLRTSRQFPKEVNTLSNELERTYIDVANQVNVRTIGIFSTVPIITGETWYTSGGNTRQQTMRQVFIFSSTTAINHNITNVSPQNYTRNFGSYTDGTNAYGLIYGSSVAIAGQIVFYVTSTQIVFVVGAGAPALTSGKIVLEWIAS